MGIVSVYVVYLLFSVALTVVTAVILTRSGKILLTQVFGDETAGRAVTSLVVVGSTLLNLGFVVLAMRTSANVHDTRQAIELLSVKLGEVLLIIGTLYICSLATLARISGRRISRRPDQTPGSAPGSGPRAELWRPAGSRPDRQDQTLAKTQA